MSLKDKNIWENFLGKQLLLIALSIVLISHGVISYYTMPKTYDAYIHLFFADHYGRFWFEPWEYRWYTGFLTISYPPLTHQVMALIGEIFPLKVAFCIYATVVFEILVIGVYRFSKLFFDKKVAGVAALVVVFLSSIIETLHVFGQIPTLTGLAFLLNALPFLYQFITKKKAVYLVLTLSFIGVTICSHHVTAIFGMVFFIAPTIWMALNDQVKGSPNLFKSILETIKLAFKQYLSIGVFGGLMLGLAIFLIMPYWIWSKSDPISQVTIPHGSRDNFLVNTSSGLMFFVIPLILIFSLLPAITFYITKQFRFLGWAVSFFACLLFGSGGTTPLTKMILGSNAFNILTLDRFGLWASIISIPFIAKFLYEFIDGNVKKYWIEKFGAKIHFLFLGLTATCYLIFIVFIFHLGSFRSLQPKEIDIKPIQNFLNRDDHMRWRFMTLGFGDQMAWLSANTLAASVDGNYHSARRLPEMTSRPVERLENAKFSGDGGMESLKDFLINAEKYSLKYVFSNDGYYDPILYYTGWTRTIRLENGIMVWEKGNISTIKFVQPKEVKKLFKYMWGILPVSALVNALMLTLVYLLLFKQVDYAIPNDNGKPIGKKLSLVTSMIPLIIFSGFISRQVYELLLVKEQKTPTTTALNFYNKLDLQLFEDAFRYYMPNPTYTIDQFLLEKSVTDGGLIPNYAKLDSISVKTIHETSDSASLKVYKRWNTSLGKFPIIDTMQLVKYKKSWFIIPAAFSHQMPDHQVSASNYVLFKKMGKRFISSFPALKDDRIKKPFIACRQLNLYRLKDKIYLTGELLNADDIPVNLSVKATIFLKNGSQKDFFPGTLMQYNLSPKASTVWQIDLDHQKQAEIKNIEIRVNSDITERGYLHGGSIAITPLKRKEDQYDINIQVVNDWVNDITIPAVLISEHDLNNHILQVQLAFNTNGLKSGQQVQFAYPFNSIQKITNRIDDIPIKLLINEKLRKIDQTISKTQVQFKAVAHSFIADAIYLQ